MKARYRQAGAATAQPYRGPPPPAELQPLTAATTPRTVASQLGGRFRAAAVVPPLLSYSLCRLPPPGVLGSLAVKGSLPALAEGVNTGVHMACRVRWPPPFV